MLNFFRKKREYFVPYVHRGSKLDMIHDLFARHNGIITGKDLAGLGLTSLSDYIRRLRLAYVGLHWKIATLQTEKSTTKLKGMDEVHTWYIVYRDDDYLDEKIYEINKKEVAMGFNKVRIILQ